MNSFYGHFRSLIKEIVELAAAQMQIEIDELREGSVAALLRQQGKNYPSIVCSESHWEQTC